MITHITVEDAAKLISRIAGANEMQALTYIREAADRGEIQAADALEKLRVELEQAKAEQDAAIKDLNEFLAMDELCPIQCEWCKWNGTYCDGKTPEWRGLHKEE